MQEDTKSFGEVFKQRRKEMNISLKEAENATSIRINYLQAIEEGDFKRLISPVYAQGFIQQYGSFLGLEPQTMTRDYSEFFTKEDTQDFSYGIGTLEVRGNPGAGVKWFPNAVWISLSILIVLAAWYVARAFEVI